MRWRLVALDVRVNGDEPRVHGTLDGATTVCGKKPPRAGMRGVAGRVTCTKCARIMVAFARDTLAVCGPARPAIEPWVRPGVREPEGDDAP
jgi:hypothetical protein